VIILKKRVDAVLDAYEISRYSYRKIVQNVSLAFLFNGLGIPAAAAGLVYPIWGMVAMAAGVTTIFINSLWGRGASFFQAIKTVGPALSGCSLQPEELASIFSTLRSWLGGAVRCR
jgi:P-type Cu+ transporter